MSKQEGEPPHLPGPSGSSESQRDTVCSNRQPDALGDGVERKQLHLPEQASPERTGLPRALAGSWQQSDSVIVPPLTNLDLPGIAKPLHSLPSKLRKPLRRGFVF